MIVDLIAGARPNFVKLAPVLRAIAEVDRLVPRVVHTGQHYDALMNEVFFNELGIPEPDVHLDVGSGSHGAQTARILERYEAHLGSDRPAATVVFGDVNSTVACALAAVKLGVPVAHVEAGLRSFDRSMPEEINRILTDAIAGLLLVSEPSGMDNLRHEGIGENRIRLVGNVMIDTLQACLAGARRRNVVASLGLDGRPYGLVTMHRPSNVDDPVVLGSLLDLLRELSGDLNLIFPVHPRTRKAAAVAGLGELLGGECGGFLPIEPLSYLDNLSVMAGARVVLTDSGGMQEETTALGVPCITLRDSTERPITLERGTSRLAGNNPEAIRGAFRQALQGDWPTGQPIPLWDGRAGERIAKELASWLGR